MNSINKLIHTFFKEKFSILVSELSIQDKNFLSNSLNQGKENSTIEIKYIS